MKAYYFERGIPVKMEINRKGNTINEDGTGWLTCVWGELIKPKLNKINGKWQVIETATPNEISAFQKQKQIEKNTQFAQLKVDAGKQYYQQIDVEVVGIMKGKTPTEIDTVDKQYRSKILPYLELVKGGNWWTARRQINNRTLPTNNEIKTLFLKVRQDIRDFVENNYK
jgi:hypothetical protein